MVAVLATPVQQDAHGHLACAAVADDTLAAQSIGIRLPHIWRIVWSVSGLVALVAGLLWGARQGVQFSLSLVVLKAMPVLIIGGFSSIPGAIVGGLLVGATRKSRRHLHRPARPRQRLQLVRLHSGGRLPARSDRPACSAKTQIARVMMTTVATPIADRSAPISPRRLAILAGLAARRPAFRWSASDYWLNSLIIPTIVMGLGRSRPQPSHGLRRPRVAGVRRVHVDRRLLGLQSSVARAASASAAGARRRRADRRRASASCSACRACASKASTSARRLSARSSSSSGCSPTSIGSRTTASP